jgi:hypothetical protein
MQRWLRLRQFHICAGFVTFREGAPESEVVRRVLCGECHVLTLSSRNIYSSEKVLQMSYANYQCVSFRFL